MMLVLKRRRRSVRRWRRKHPTSELDLLVLKMRTFVYEKSESG
jgi:hypothetical protein